MEISKSKIFIKLCILVCLLLAIALNNRYIILIILTSIIFLKKNNIYLLFIISPLLEAITPITGSLSWIKYITFIYFIIFFILFLTRKIKFVKSFYLTTLILLIISIILGILIFNFKFSMNEIGLVPILSENLTRMLKIILSMMLFVDFANKNKDTNKKNLYDISINITIILIGLGIYGIINPTELNTWVGSEEYVRSSLGELDLNQYAIYLAILIVFPLFNYFSNIKNLRIISLISIGVTIVTILFTLSKSGILTLIFIIVIYFIFINKAFYKEKKSVLIITSMALLILLWITSNLLNILKSRFVNSYSTGGLESLTTNRLEYWINGIETTFNNSLIFGFGGANHSGMYINYLYTGNYIVMHSIYVSAFVEYGLIGIIMIILVIYNIVNRFWLIKTTDDKVLLLPFISTFGLLFAGISINFMFIDLLWIFLGLSMGCSNHIKYEETKNLLNNKKP